MTLSERLKPLISDHCAWLARHMGEIETLFAHTRAWGGDREDVEALHDAVHQVTGASGTMGFGEVSTAAGDLEACLRRFLDGPGLPPETDWRSAATLLGRLRRAAGRATPERSALLEADFSLFGRHRPPSAPSPRLASASRR